MAVNLIWTSLILLMVGIYLNTVATESDEKIENNPVYLKASKDRQKRMLKFSTTFRVVASIWIIISFIAFFGSIIWWIWS